MSVDDQSIVTQTSGLAAVNISAGSSTKRIFKVWDADERASIGVETDASIFLDEDLIIEAGNGRVDYRKSRIRQGLS